MRLVMTAMTGSGKQDGAALVVGLVLLVVVTVLAISGMNTATTELAMARNDQNYENAFQAAETGIETALARGSFNTADTTIPTQTIVVPDRNFDTVDVTIEFEDTTIVPDKAFSLGAGSGIAAYHFTATAVAESARAGIGAGNDTDRDASAVHTQAFYVVGPGAPTL
jgi:type IV pilus assembly protein PilX